MNDKIVSICMTIFMLIMCIGLITVFQFTNSQKNQNIALERTSQAVLSTDGEVKADSGVLTTGESLISSIKYINAIDTQRSILGKSTIYTEYKVMLGADRLTKDNVESLVTSGSNYTMTYDLDAKKITVKRS